jgi:tetratricopeptide (TPR) repeat protein
VRLQEEEDTETDSLPTYRAIAANQDLEVQVRLHVSSMHHRAGRKRAALEELDRVIEIDPDVAELYSRRGQLYYDLGEYGRAKDSVQRYLQLTDAAFEDTNVRRAYELITKCDAALRGEDPESR